MTRVAETSPRTESIDLLAILENLFQAHLEGDELATRRLHEAVATWLKGRVMRVTRALALPDDRYDVVLTHTCEAVLKHLPDLYDPTDPTLDGLSAWAYRVASNRALTILRGIRRDEKRFVSIESVEVAGTEFRTAMARELDRRRMRNAVLRALFDSANAPHKVLCAAFYFFLEYRPREIVEELGGVSLKNLTKQFARDEQRWCDVALVTVCRSFRLRLTKRDASHLTRKTPPTPRLGVTVLRDYAEVPSLKKRIAQWNTEMLDYLIVCLREPRGRSDHHRSGRD
jgi:DNA-directed RNA polymerase specialized sigma24 family protein